MSKSRWEQSVWSAFISKISGLVRPTRQSHRRTRQRRLVITSPAEFLEDRTVPALGVSFAAGVLSLTNGTAAAEAIVVTASSTSTNVAVNGSVVATVPGATSSTISSVSFASGAAADSLQLVGINGPLAVTLGETGTLTVNSGNLTVNSSGPFAFGNTSVNGTLTVSTTNDSVTDTGKLVVSGATSINVGTGDITLDSSGNTFGSLTLTGANVTMVEAAATDLASVTATTLSLTSSGTVNDSGIIAVTGATTITASGRDVVLDSASNDFNSISVTAANITLRDSDDIVLDTINATGLLRVTAGTTIADTTRINAAGATTLAGSAITLDSTTNSFGPLSLSVTGNATIVENAATDLAASTVGGTLSVSSAGAITDSGKLAIAGTTSLTTAVLVPGSSFAITLDQAQSTYGTLVLTGSNIVVVEGAATDLGTTIATGALTVQSTGAITQSGAITAAGNTTLLAPSNNITLNNAANTFGTLALRGVNVVLSENDATNFSISNITGTLAVTSTGAITDSGRIRAAGAVSLSAVGQDITLDSPSGSFGSLTLTGANVRLVEAAATDLAASTITGNFALTSSGLVTQSGVLSVTGTATIVAGANAITLTNASNNFGSLVLSGSNIAVSEGSDTTLGTMIARGALSVTSTGTINDDGVITASGKTTIVGTTVTLDSATNTFGTLEVTATSGATLVENASTDFGTSNITGALTVTSTGGFTDSGNILVSGVATLSSTSQPITLDATGSNFGALVLSGSNIAVREASATQLDSVTATGTFRLISGGAITDNGNLAIAGKATFIAAPGSDVTLDSVANAFGSFSASGANITLIESDAADLSTISATGTLAVTSQGAITDSGVITISASTTLNANGNAITLDVVSSKYGSLALSGSNATLVNSAAIDLAASTLTGTLIVTAKSLSDSGDLAITGQTTINTGTGAVTLDSNNTFGTIALTAGTTLINETAATDLGLSKISGNLTLTSAGAVTDSDVLSIIGATSINAAGNDITLDSGRNNFGGTISFNGDDVQIVDSTALTLGKAVATSSTKLQARGNITDTVALSLAGTTSLIAIGGEITLNDDGTLGTLSLAGRAATLVNGGAVDLGTVGLNGNFSLTTGGEVTQSGGALTVLGNLTVAAGANDITLTNASNTFLRATLTGASIALRDAGALDLGAVTATTSLTLTAGGAINDFGMITAGTTSITAGKNAVTLDNTTSNYGTELAFVSASHVLINNSSAIVLGASTLAGSLSVTAAGITDNGPLTVGGLTTLNAGTNDITLDHVGASFGTLKLTANNAAIIEDAAGAATDLGHVTLAGDFTLTSDGAITDSGALSVGGALQVTSLTNATITLNNATNQFSGTISTDGGATTLVDTTAIEFLSVDTNGGSLTITAGGAVTDSGPIRATGAVTITATGFDITLDDSAGDFGTLSLAAANVAIIDSVAADLGTSTITGVFDLKASGAVTQSGAITTNGTTSIDATGFSITLTNVANAFGTLLLSGTDVALTENSATDLGTSTITGTLDITSSGAVTDSGTLTINGASSFSTGASQAAITLDDISSTFAAPVSLSGGNVAIRAAGALDFALVTATGTLSVFANGDITNSGNLSVTGAASFNAGTTNNITLTTGTINFGSLNANGDSLDLVEASSAVFGTITTAANFTYVAAGAITDAGVVIVGGNSDITAIASPITLDTPTSNYGNGTGTISLAGSNVALRTDAAAPLDVVQATGSLTVTAAGNISDSGTADIDVGTTTNLDTGSGDINVVAAANSFAGAINLRGTNSTLTVGSAVDLGAVNLSGTFSLTASGAITDSGAVHVTGTITLNAGTDDITLDTASNTFGPIVIMAADDVTLTEAAATSFGAVDASTLAVTSLGTITQTVGSDIVLTGAVAHTASFTASGFSITLSNSTNDFGAAGSSTAVLAQQVMLQDADDFELSSATVSGNLAITAGGAVTNSGTLTVTGTTNVTATGFDITFGSAAATFAAGITLTGDNITLTSGSVLTLASVTATGSLEITSTGAVTDIGAIDVAGTTTVTATGQAITLDAPANTFQGDLVLSGANISITNDDTTDTQLGAITATGTLTINSASDVLDNGTLTVSDATTITTSGDDITLNDANSQFATLHLSGANLDITNARATDLGTVTATGSFQLTSTSGAITDSGTITINGATSIDAGTFSITLNSAGSTYSGPLDLAGSNIVVSNNTATDLGAITALNDLSVTSAGAISDSGILTVTGTSSFTALGNDISLDQASDFGGALSFVADDVTLTGLGTNSDAILGNATLTGMFDFNSNNIAITSAGSVLTVAGDVVLTSGTADITVTLSGSSIGGTLGLIGDDLTVSTTGEVVLGTVTAGGDLDLTTTGSVMDNGVVTVTGTTAIAAGASSITLDDATSAYNGAITLSGANIALLNSVATNLASVIANGTLAIVTSNDPITDSGTLTVSGTTTLHVGTADITLANASSTFGTLVLIGDVVSMTDAGAVDLGTVTATSLTIAASGAITDSGVITVSGATSLAASGFAITLNSSTSTYIGTLSLVGTNIDITSNSAVDFGNVSANGNLNVVANGAITDAAGTAIVVTGDTIMNAGTNSIILDEPGRSFGGSVLLFGNPVSF